MVARKTSNEAPKSEAPKSVARRQILLAQFRPSKEWVATNLLADGKSNRQSIARIFGIVMNVERRPVQLPDGTPTETVVCTGAFRCENYADGEKGDSRNVVFPIGYAQALEATFKLGNPFEVDVDIDIEANEKGATTWIVVPHVTGEDLNYLDNVAASRARPETAAVLTTPAGSVSSSTDQPAPAPAD